MNIKYLFHFLLALSFLLLGTQSSKAQIRVACVGNSITFGSGIENREQFSYPAQLQTLLGEGWEVKNFGVSGRTMLKKGNQPLWKEKKFAQALAYKPDVVIIKLGTNDSKPFNWVHKKEFAVDYQAMVDTFRQNSDPLIFVVLPVPVFETKWGINAEVVENEVIPIARQIAAKNQLPSIDLFTPFLDKEVLFPDKIHPNGHGAALMAGIVGRHLVEHSYSILMKKSKE